MLELEVLKWIADLREHVAVSGSCDQDMLGEAIIRHRLVTRFLHKHRVQPQPWVTRSLHLRLLAYQHLVERNFRRNLAAMREIIAAYGIESPPLIAIKGYTAHILTGNPLAVRESGDIDIFSSDPAQLVQALKRIGYRQDDQASAHEFATMSREDVHVEVHNYFPVLTYPTHTNQSEVWIKRSEIRVDKITYRDLLEHHFVGSDSNAAGLVVPNVSLAVLVGCANILRDYWIDLVLKDMATIRLGDLAEVCELLKQPRFDVDEFSSLVNQFNGYDSISFVGYLLENHTGHNPFASLFPQASRTPPQSRLALPRHHWQWTCVDPNVIECAPDDLIIRQNKGSVEYIVDKLSANLVSANSSDRKACYSNIQLEGCRTVVAQETGGLTLPLKFSIACDQEILTLEVTILEALNSYMEGISVWVGEGVCVWWYNTSDRRFWTLQLRLRAQTSLKLSQNYYTVRFVFPWESIPETAQAQGVIPLLIGAAKRGEDSSILAGALVPVLARKQSLV